ncbi:peptidoglycan DD-metalloendopeptidase family protein [Thioalkalivibrio sp.]|uniref:peptidoglycan DD-metalloendopeptidase family protein n=1 Tax=Thioalkalivibrio sp. TaxID=2093813 RepID=UPI0039755DE4
MPLTKAILPLIVMGGLGITAVVASSLLPAGSATRAIAAEIAATDLDPGDHSTGQRPRLSLLHDRACLPEGNRLEDLRAAARLALADGDLLRRTRVTGQGLHASTAPAPRSGLADPLKAATSYAALDLDLDDTGSLPLRNEARWSRHMLSEGEHLAGLWSDAWGLRLRTLYQLLEEAEGAELLNRVYPGQEIEWQVDAKGALKRLRLWKGNRAEGNEWLRVAGGGYQRHQIQGARDITHQVLTGPVHGEIATSLEVNDGLPTSTAKALAIRLIRHLPLPDDVRDGDQYALLVETETLAGDDTPYDIRLLAFDYSGHAFTVSAVRHSNGRFYTSEGRSLLPPFDRLPFTGNHRISSSYNPGRRHPVTGRVAPHRGTDFPMPVGTPIVAPASGKVTQVDSHPAAGRHVVIEHGQGYTTRYLHLQKALVRPGQTVKRGQRIALSGNSGRTTSPHLHYELHIDGRAVDAMRAELPDNEVLSGAELEGFQRLAQPLLAELREAAPSRQIAMTPFPGPGF